GQIIAPGWHALAIDRRAPNPLVGVVVDGTTVSSNTTTTFSGWTLNELYLGLDPRITGAPQQVAYFREWPAFLGSYGTEWQSPVPVRTSDLDTDTPLSLDLLDTTANDHDWRPVGAVSSRAEPIATGGAMGGWWFGSPTFNAPITPQTPVLRAETVGGATPGIIADFWIIPTGQTSEGDTITAATYDVLLRYWNGTTMAEQRVGNPIADPIIGQTYPYPARNAWGVDRE